MITLAQGDDEPNFRSAFDLFIISLRCLVGMADSRQLKSYEYELSLRTLYEAHAPSFTPQSLAIGPWPSYCRKPEDAKFISPDSQDIQCVVHALNETFGIPTKSNPMCVRWFVH